MAIRAEGELVLRSLRACVGALEAQDVELADEVIAFDDEIDRSYSALQEGVHAILARQTPVAGDLRLVLAMLHINLHLERMGDYCVTIAKLTKLAHGLASDRALVEGIDEMGARAEEMIRVALDSFGDRDLEGAERLVELDELIDRANRRVAGETLRAEDAITIDLVDLDERAIQAAHDVADRHRRSVVLRRIEPFE